MSVAALETPPTKNSKMLAKGLKRRKIFRSPVQDDNRSEADVTETNAERKIITEGNILPKSIKC